MISCLSLPVGIFPFFQILLCVDNTFGRYILKINKANLRDLIAGTGLLILLKLDWNCQFFSVWPWNWMDDLKKLEGASSTLHQALCIISNPSMNSNWSYCPETHNSGQNRWFCFPCDIEIWRMTLKNNRAPLLCHIKLCASFQAHWWIHSNLSYSPEMLNSGRNRRFFKPCDLEILRMTLENNRALLLCYFKLCASFRSHWWIQTGVTVQKGPIWVKLDDF